MEASIDPVHHQDVKPFYMRNVKKRLSSVFADAKESIVCVGLTLRGLKKLLMQAMLTFAAINLKKMATWTWQGPKIA